MHDETASGEQRPEEGAPELVDRSEGDLSEESSASELESQGDPNLSEAGGEPSSGDGGAAEDGPDGEVEAEAVGADGSDSIVAEVGDEDETPADVGEEINMEWYVLKVQSNREKSIRNSLLKRIKREGLERYFGEVVIPTEKVAETKGGKKRVREQKLYPGYIMIHMELNDESWYLVRDTGGVGDFTGAAGKPIPMQEHEIQRMLGIETSKEEEKQPVVKIPFKVGDVVKIKEGTFESFEGSVDAIDELNGKISVLIEIFGRSTPVELEYWQVEDV